MCSKTEGKEPKKQGRDFTPIGRYVGLVTQSCPTAVMWPHGLQPGRLLCPWDSPGKNPGVVCHFLLQGIFPAHGWNPGLLHCRQNLYRLSRKGSPIPFPNPDSQSPSIVQCWDDQGWPLVLYRAQLCAPHFTWLIPKWLYGLSQLFFFFFFVRMKKLRFSQVTNIPNLIVSHSKPMSCSSTQRRRVLGNHEKGLLCMFPLSGETV